MSEPKLNIKEETSTQKTRSPPKKAKVEQSVPKKKKLKTDADKAAEKAQHLRFGKAELTPDELSRLSKAQKREMYAAHAARSAVHREVDQYEDGHAGFKRGRKSGRKCPGYFQKPLCPEAQEESQDAGQEEHQNRKIFCTRADCGTRCRRIRHRRGRLQLAFSLETAAKNPQKLLCRRPVGHGGADRRRQSGIQRCICRPVRRRTGGGERQNCRQHRCKRADERR